MKKLEKAFKKVFGIHEPSKMYEPKTTSFKAIQDEVAAGQARLHRMMLNSTYGFAKATIECDEEKKETKECDEKEETKEETKEEWIWVNGYKATDKDMKCRDYQYEMNKQFDMPEDAEISTCSSGFHLCTDLEDTFCYYEPKDGNRYFHVRALVRKSDYVNVNATPTPGTYAAFLWAVPSLDTKLAAKSIEFVSEVSREEFEHTLLKSCITADKLSPEFLTMVPNISVHEALQKQKIHELEEAGYPYTLAKYIMGYGGNDAYDKAMDLATTDTITLDTKVLLACGVDSIEEG